MAGGPTAERFSTPSSLIVTLGGLYLREIGGRIPVKGLIQLLSTVDVPATAARQALVRLKARGFLASERIGSQAGYRLTRDALVDLAVGDDRIFRYGQAPATDGWVLAVFSVPEHARNERHRLRRQLSWLGFGTVTDGVWIAPSSLADRAVALVTAAGLADYVTWFAGDSIGRVEVGHWWDLAALRTLYLAFLDRWSAQRVPIQLTDGAAFARYVTLVDHWRQFPRIDPGLPARLLPDDWQGRQAWELFDLLHRRWAAGALRHLRATLDSWRPPQQAPRSSSSIVPWAGPSRPTSGR